jgi:hypothetical protein
MSGGEVVGVVSMRDILADYRFSRQSRVELRDEVTA